MDYIGERILDSNWTVLNYPTFKIAVDKMSIPYLEGSTLDWEQNGINEEFVFRNPNEQSRCGCGVSAIF
jgi:iron-sulfur cluster assembly protein